MNALLSIMLLFAIHREREPVYYQYSDSLKPIVVETENKLSLTLNLVKSACIDSCYFISHVYTPVCEENICYPIELEIRWDLLGYFKDYETPVKHPLTKFDHQLLTDRDQIKMRAILSNKYSVLRNMKVDDLIDKSITIKSAVKVDGVTGATRPSLKEEVVQGAIYSTYTLWHLVNGAAADSIRKRTESRLDNDLLRDFLRSGNPQYHYFALEKLPDDQKEPLKDDIIRLVRYGEGNVPFFAFDRLPQAIWSDPVYQTRLISMTGSLDFRLKNAILNQLLKVSLSAVSLDSLVSNLYRLTDQQLLKALTIIERNVVTLASDAVLRLKSYQNNNDNEEVAKRISRILSLWNNRSH